MAHTFLLESGRWIIRGNWFDKNQNQISITGGTIVAWDQPNWFSVKTKLVFDQKNLPDIDYELKGYLPHKAGKYKYISLNHSMLGKIEGEGWVGFNSIVQRYLVLNDNTRQNGFETLFCLDENTYHFNSSISTGNILTSNMEAFLERSL